MYLNKSSFFPRRPNGMKLVETNLLIRGSHHRKEELEGFLNEFDRLKPETDKATVEVFHDEGNKHDKHAIGVMFTTTRKTWLGWKNRFFHIGYIEADLAHKVHSVLINSSTFTKLETLKVDNSKKYPHTIIVSIYSEPTK